MKGRDFQPVYLATERCGLLEEKVRRALAALKPCRLCPRDCGVDRLADDQGVCQSGRWAVVASVFPHFGEEHCLRGSRGSGTIFFSGCNLRCVFCQNFDISWQRDGSVVRAGWLAEQMLRLQHQGCHNINLVTPEHVVPQILEGILLAVRVGLHLPIVYNTSAYDGLESLHLLEGVIDIYMPDFKFWDADRARRFALADDYPAVARAAIVEMHRQVGDLVLDERGLARRGLLVRHLVMPGGIAETRAILRFLADEVSSDTFVNLMSQYRPAGWVSLRPGRYVDIERTITERELHAAYEAALAAGLHRFAHPYRAMDC